MTNCRLSTYCNILSPAMGFVCLSILRNILLYVLPKKLAQKNNSLYKQGFSIGYSIFFSKTGKAGPSLPRNDQIRAKDLLS